ncbi:MAG: DUF2167 domain-containing protein [Planctomycetota bacterium]|jgi:uncharacterized membrane-anchored protein
MLLATLDLSVAPALPQDEAELEFEAFLQEFVAELDFREGQVTVHGGDVIFDLPEGWALLDSRDARAVVEDLWGNPEDPSTVAFIDPPSPDGRLGSAYGIIVTVDESGYVKDEDSQNIDYGDLLKTIQKDAKEANEYRTANGFEPVEIVGWAEPPHYDMREKKLYWAKELKFGDDPERTLNYDVRVLGRKGYVMLQAVAPIGALAEVDAGMKMILDSTEFAEGMRYFDFDSSVDKVAVYGIGGLIAGKALAKVGAFAVLAKFGKFIVLGIIGAFVALKKFVFGRGSEVAYEEEPAAEETA